MLELHDTVRLREQGVVAAAADVDAGMELGAALADEDVAGQHVLAAELLDAKRFDSESRPLRVLPPAFLCAMVFSLAYAEIAVILTSVKCCR